VKFSAAERDNLLLKLVELDPAGRHASPSFDSVTDLPRLWRSLEKASKVLEDLPVTTGLGELKASAAHLAQSKESSASRWELGPTKKDFANIILSRIFVQALQRYLSSLNSPDEENTAAEAAGKSL
jgi:hypothetical protein